MVRIRASPFVLIKTNRSKLATTEKRLNIVLPPPRMIIMLAGLKNSYLLGQSFFADRVCNILSKEGRISEGDEVILRRALEYLDSTKKGEQIVKTGQLSSSAVESVDAYRRAIVVFSKGVREEEKVEFDVKIQNLKNRLSKSLEVNFLEHSEIHDLYGFFSGIREVAAKEGTRHLADENGILEWTTT